MLGANQCWTVGNLRIAFERGFVEISKEAEKFRVCQTSETKIFGTLIFIFLCLKVAHYT